MRQFLDDRQRALTLAESRHVQLATAWVERASSRLMQSHPRHRIGLAGQKLGEIRVRLNGAMARFSGEIVRERNAAGCSVAMLSPEAVRKARLFDHDVEECRKPWFDRLSR